MATTIKTSDGDVLDSLCLRSYGHLLGSVEAVLEANPGLAGIPQPFAVGVQIYLPELASPRTDVIQLWD
ncbi:TPA: tail protein X [Enterobacter roggenkampii]|uniref:Phage tail protein n=1 Tax=Enterobacter roggenkampii TaxID=1812935 RepID=A0AAU9C4J5_9ENTR|nr:tail protein X [Enterobacter roggenkampii]BCL40998.1 phage tail protein [Enterobacter roggenkampii]HDT2084596.1 tail protein X [Enterobacter roggenkampii]